MNNNKSIAYKIKEVGSHGMVYGFGTVLESLLQILLIPLFLNKFSPTEYGAFSLIQITASMAGAFFYFGGSTALNRFYYDASNDREQKIWFSNILFLTFFGSTLMILLAVLFGEFFVYRLFGELTFIYTFYFLFLSLSLTIINTIFYLLTRLLKKSTLFVTLKLISLLSSITAIIILINTMDNILEATALGFLVGQAIVLSLMLIKYKSSIIFIFDFTLIKKYLKFGIPMAISGLLFIAIDWMIRFFVNKDLGTESLGLYSMGLKFGSLIQAGFIMPFSLIWSTIRMEYRKDKNTFDFFNKVTTYFLLSGFFIILIISININEIISLISIENVYEGALIVIPVILFSQLILGTINILDYGLIISNKTIYYPTYYLIVLLVVTIVGFFLFNYVGILGAAIIHLISNSIIALLVYLKSNEFFKININYRTIFPSLLVCIILFFLSKYFSNSFNDYHIWKIFLKNGFTIITFFIFIFMFLPVMDRNKIYMILSEKIKNLTKKW